MDNYFESSQFIKVAWQVIPEWAIYSIQKAINTDLDYFRFHEVCKLIVSPHNNRISQANRSYFRLERNFSVYADDLVAGEETEAWKFLSDEPWNLVNFSVEKLTLEESTSLVFEIIDDEDNFNPNTSLYTDYKVTSQEFMGNQETSSYIQFEERTIDELLYLEISYYRQLVMTKETGRQILTGLITGFNS